MNFNNLVYIAYVRVFVNFISYEYWFQGPLANLFLLNQRYDKEKSLYDYQNPGFKKEYSAFTQVVWKSTTKIGCAYKIVESAIFIVVKYAPPGNILGMFGSQVCKPKPLPLSKELQGKYIEKETTKSSFF